MKGLYDILKEYVEMKEPPTHLVVEGEGKLLALFGFVQKDGKWLITLEEAKKQFASLGNTTQYEVWSKTATARHLDEIKRALNDRQ